MGMSVLRLVSPTHPAAAPLLAGLRHEYTELYGPDVATELDRHSPIEFLPPSGAFLILEQDGVTAAGGALRRLGPGVGEIKRMWTDRRFRGRGYARIVLAELERAALRRGYHTLRLETGNLSLAAIGVYASVGYDEIAPYGSHAADPRCVSFEKRLDGRDHVAPDALDRREIVVRQMLEHHALHAGRLEAA
jgi:ribosomal protein S18 acetylase RimI-like enzyme